MNSKIKFFQSIHFKIALVFALVLLITIEIIGAVFVRQLERQNLNTFKQQIELPAYIENSISEQLSNTDTKAANKKIKAILSDVNNANITEIRVIDSKGIIRGTSSVNNQSIVGQKTTNEDIKKTISNNRSYDQNVYDDKTNTRYYVSSLPLLNSSTNSSVAGALYMRANLESVYASINKITLLSLSAALVAIALGLFVAIVISRAISVPIDEMKKQSIRIARGDFSGHVKVYGNDELGQLAGAVNNLSVRVEEAQDSTEADRRRLDGVLRHMSDGVLATDRRGNVTIINETATDLLSSSSETTVGTSILDVLHIRKDYTIRELLESEEEIIIDLSTEANELILHAYFSLIQRESGFISGLVCVLHDVTEQQREEQERRQFVSNVSHELRTPLTSVRSYIEALSDGAWKDPELAPNFLAVVQDETERMIRMINDLLSLSRMDAGTSKLNFEYINLNELINYILNRFDMILNNPDDSQPSKTYKIERIITDKDLWVDIDTDKFTQVVDNLMNNAIKYSPDGGTITVRLLETHNHVILTVSDQGLGIPRKDIAHVFDRFFRVDKARSRKQGGTGLGLAISKEVINLLGGQIWVDSVEGRGSNFYISLPYVPYEGDEWDDDSENS